MTRSATVVLTLLACVAALLTITTWASRRTHNAQDFVLANRRLDWWLTASSYVANALNPWMLMSVTAAAFAWGLSAVWMWLAMLLGCVINVWVFAPRLRALSLGTGALTLVQVLSADAGDRMQPIVVRSAVFIVLITLLLQITAAVQLAGDLLADKLGVTVAPVAAFSVVAIAVSVFAGGLRAASATESAQTVMVLGLALFLLLPVLVATGGREELQAAFGSLGPESTDWFNGKRGVAALAFAAGTFGLGLAMWGQPHVLVRFMAAKDEAVLRVSRWIATAWVAILLAAVVVGGWSARVLYAGIERPEQSLAIIASRLLPPSLAVIIVLMLAAALITAIGSQLLAMAASLAVDLKRPTAPVSLPWLRAALVATAILACGSALYVSPGILEHGMFAFTALGASLGPLLLVRLSGKRIRPGATLGAMWAGFVLSALFHLLPDSPGDFLERVLPFVAALGIALTGGERRRNPDRADRSQETVHDRVPI